MDLDGLEGFEPIFDEPDGGASGGGWAEVLGQLTQRFGFGLADFFANHLGVWDLDPMLVEQLVDETSFFGADDYSVEVGIGELLSRWDSRSMTPG